MGAPAEAIIKIAKEIGADLVVIARVGKQSTKRDVGHTAAKVIDTLDANLLVLPMTEST
jgi:nucleotide-binding universal stress UspA family protein